MTGYQEGVRVEREVIHDLTAKGWLCTRAASSKGVADVIAIGPENPGIVAYVALISCKRTTMPGPKERAGLIAAADRAVDVLLPIVALHPRREPLQYRLLTGPGPKDWQEWET